MEKPTVTGSESPTLRRTVARGAGDDPQTVPGAQPAGNGRGPVVLGRYRLHRQLGAGGFGTVWLARDERLERDVAVKIVPRERVVGGRFEREARAAARLAHPGIVTLYEAGADDEGAYLVSELVRGATLGDMLSAGRLSDRDIVEVGIAMCDALSHAHAEGVVHRDVKPSNVLIPERPAVPGQPAKLTDFGVAYVVGGDSITRTGDVLGTAAYMAPEQAAGREVTAAADLYSLALVLYEALTGVNPVRASTAATRARRLGAHLPPLRRQRRDLPRGLGQCIDLALRPRPRERGRLEDLRASLAAALPDTEDQPGIVAGLWRARPRAAAPRDVALPDRWVDADPTPAHDDGKATDAGLADETPGAQDRPTLGGRALAGLATAVLTGWLLAHVMQPWPVAPVAVAVLAGALIAAVPRVGWLALTATLAFSLLLEQRPGGALVLAVAGLLPIAVVPYGACAWPLSCGAPLLGAIGLAGAWPALAARATGAWRRAALGFTGWLWLLLAEPLAGTNLYLGRARGAPSPAVWTASLHDTIHHVLAPLASASALAPAVVWAAAAAVLPRLTRGRSIYMDAVRVIAWAALVLALTGALHGHAPQRGAMLGAIAAVLVAMAPAIGVAVGAGHTARRFRMVR